MKSSQFPKFPVHLSVRLTTNLQLRDMFSPDGTLKKTDMTHEPRKKKNKPYGFHYSGCFIGILTMVEYNPYIHWVVSSPIYTLKTTRVFFRAHMMTPWNVLSSQKSICFKAPKVADSLEMAAAAPELVDGWRVDANRDNWPQQKQAARPLASKM